MPPPSPSPSPLYIVHKAFVCTLDLTFITNLTWYTCYRSICDVVKLQFNWLENCSSCTHRYYLNLFSDTYRQVLIGKKSMSYHGYCTQVPRVSFVNHVLHVMYRITNYMMLLWCRAFFLSWHWQTWCKATPLLRHLQASLVPWGRILPWLLQPCHKAQTTKTWRGPWTENRYVACRVEGCQKVIQVLLHM